MNTPINHHRLETLLLSKDIVDFHTDRNSDGHVCEVALILHDDTAVIIKTGTNQPLVFEREEAEYE